MRSIMLCGFALVIVGCFAGDLFMLGVGVVAQIVGTFGCLGEGRID